MVCTICGYVGEIGPSVSGYVSIDGTYDDITLELISSDGETVEKTIIISNDSYEYLIKDVESGEYFLRVSADGYATRTYAITIGDTTTLLDICLYESGDANMDGVVDALDYQYVVNVAVSDAVVPAITSYDSEYRLALCDYACDGYIDVLDCFLIARITDGGLPTQSDSIEIIGVSAPVVNGLPSYNATLDDSKYEIYDETFGYIYNGVTWYDLTDDTNVDVDDVFKAGHTYKLVVEVVPISDDWNLKYATINGETALVEEASDCYLVSCTFIV